MVKEHEFMEGTLYLHFDDGLYLVLNPSKHDSGDILGVDKISLYHNGNELFNLSNLDNINVSEIDQKRFLKYLRQGISYANSKLNDYLNGRIKLNQWEEKYNELCIIMKEAEKSLTSRLT